MDEQEGTPMIATVTLYTEPGSDLCRWVRHALARTGIPYETIDVTIDPEARARIRALGYDQPPVIVTGSRHWSGTDPRHIRELAEYLER
jgi:glutaredoxin-like protein NrdH